MQVLKDKKKTNMQTHRHQRNAKKSNEGRRTRFNPAMPTPAHYWPMIFFMLLSGSAFAQDRVFYSDFEKDHETWRWYTHGNGKLRSRLL
jgi:hypothetical protein